MDITKLKVGVLGGGVSLEREVSLISAGNAFDSLRNQKVNSVFIDINTRDPQIIKKTILSQDVNLVFIGLHGEFGEDGQIQQILEQMRIPYTGSGPKASFYAMDKITSKQIFIKYNIPTANFSVGLANQTPSKIIDFPVVVKPNYGGSSIGMSIVNKQADLAKALKAAFLAQPANSSGEPKVLIEEFIEGRELTVGIINDTPLAVVEIVPKRGWYDYQNKYGDNTVDFLVPAKLPFGAYGLVQQTALQAHKALGCRDFSRVDIRLDKENIPYVLEVNSIPGLTSHSLLPLSAKACGIEFDQLIMNMIKTASYGKK